MTLTDTATVLTCGRCQGQLAGTVYEMRAAVGTSLRCLRCALMYGPMLARSLVICLIVGTILTAINQGNLILRGDFPMALAWKVPLTYSVPFCVATCGAILNARSKRASQT